MGRWLRFLFVLAFGIAAGLYYSWQINPREYVDTSPDTLRQDYQADYVLMVAEVYQADGDLDQAVRRLALLGDDSPAEIVRRAIAYALGDPNSGAGQRYAPIDVGYMQALADAVSALPTVEAAP